MPDLALSHLRVLELGDKPAAYAGHFLADLGADVIKVEPPFGAPERAEPPFAKDIPGPDRGLAFIHFNTNKRGVVLDLDRKEDQDNFLHLARAADIVIEANQPGYLDARGIGYAALKSTNHGLILTQLSPFGQTGPYRDFKGNAAIAEAMSGMIFSLGDDTRAPCMSPNEIQSQIAGMHAAYVSLAAVYNRRKGGTGQSIDISLQEMGTHMFAGLADYGLTKTIRRRPGLGSLSGVTSIYKTLDGFAHIQPGDNHWPNLVEWINDPMLFEEQWQDREFRNQNGDVLRMIVEGFIAGFKTADFVPEAQRRSLPTAPINKVSDMANSEHVQVLGSFVERTHPEIGTYKSINVPFGMTESPMQFRRPAPRLGEHTAEVLAEVRAADAATSHPFEGLTAGSSLPPLEGKEPEGRVTDPPLQEGKGQARPSSLPSPAGEGIGNSTSQDATFAVPTGGSNVHRKLPLEGLRILDFTRVIAGPAGTQFLAFLGADIVKVESHLLPQSIRQPGTNFSDINRGKRSITVDSRTKQGREVLMRLAETCDVVVDNFSAGVMDRLGLGYEDFRKVKPDIVAIQMPGFGKVGPLKDWVAYGQILQAFNGLTYLWRDPETPTEACIKGPVADYVSVALLTVAVLSSIEYRDRTGKGQFVDLNMLQGLAHTLGPLYLEYWVNGRDPEPKGYWSGRYAPFGAYPCRGEDNWCVIAVETDAEWQAFKKAVGEPGWAFDERFQTKQGRLDNRAALNQAVSTWSQQYTARQVMYFMQGAGIAAGPIYSCEDTFHDYHLRSRNHIVRVEHPQPWGPFEHQGAPWKLSETPAVDTRPAPVLGEHTEEIMRELLNMSPEELKRLQEAKVLY